MGRFQELGQNINYIVDELLKDGNLLKLLYYDVYNPLSKEDISDPYSLIFDRIYPYPKIPEVQEKQKSIITITFSNARLNRNIKFKDYRILFNIIVHNNLWRIAGSIRPYEIIERIDNIFNEAENTQLSLGKVMFEDLIYREYNDKYNGFLLVYKVCDFN